MRAERYPVVTASPPPMVMVVVVVRSQLAVRCRCALSPPPFSLSLRLPLLLPASAAAGCARGTAGFGWWRVTVTPLKVRTADGRACSTGVRAMLGSTWSVR